MEYSKELHEQINELFKSGLWAQNLETISKVVSYIPIFLAEIDRLNKLTQWIPVSERLPEVDTTDLDSMYLVTVEAFGGKRFTASMSFIKGDWWTGAYGCSTNWTKNVVSWKYMPKPMEEVS